MARENSLSAAFCVISLIAAACESESTREGADTTRLAETRVAAETKPIAPVSQRRDTAATSVRASNGDSSAFATLTCIPTTFGPGDTLTLRMGTPHGHYLWITKSDRTAYLVVYPPQGELKPANSLMSSDEFTRVATIRLPSDIQAVPYVYARDTIRELVFTEAGKYLLEVGDNFATDLGSPAPSCNLTFVSRKSK